MSETQPQGSAAGILLQDSHPRVLHAPHILASHWSLSSSQREHTSGDTPACQMPYDLQSSGWNSQRQQKPRIPRYKAPQKSQRQMLPIIEEREEYMTPGPGESEERFAGLRASQASGMSHSPQVRVIGDTLGSKSLQLLPEKKQVFPESQFRKRMRCFLCV